MFHWSAIKMKLLSSITCCVRRFSRWGEDAASGRVPKQLISSVSDGLGDGMFIGVRWDRFRQWLRYRRTSCIVPMFQLPRPLARPLLARHWMQTAAGLHGRLLACSTVADWQTGSSSWPVAVHYRLGVSSAGRHKSSRWIYFIAASLRQCWCGNCAHSTPTGSQSCKFMQWRH